MGNARLNRERKASFSPSSFEKVMITKLIWPGEVRRGKAGPGGAR